MFDHSHTRRPPRAHADPQPNLAAVVQTLRAIRYAERTTLTGIAASAGISRQTLYEVIRTGHASPATTLAIATALRNVRYDEGQIDPPPGPRGGR